MISSLYRSKTRGITASIARLPKSEVFYDITNVESSSKTLKDVPSDTQTSSITNNQTNTNDSTLSPATSNSKGSQAMRRTPSPYLLACCKELLKDFKLHTKPVVVDGEPLLSQEDVELLSQIVESNERYQYLDSNDAELFKHILEINLAGKGQVKRTTSSRKSSEEEIEIKSEPEEKLLDTLRIEEEASENDDELELSWRIIEEIFRRRDKVEERDSSELSSMGDQVEQEKTASKNDSQSDLEENRSNKYSEGSSSSVNLIIDKNTEILAHEVAETVTEIKSIPDESEASSYDSSTALENDKVELKFEDTFPETSWESDFSSPLLDQVLSDALVARMIDSCTVLSEIRPIPRVCPLPTIQEVSSIRLPPLTPKERTTMGEYLYTDHVYMETEQKLLEAIDNRLKAPSNLPMSLSIKVVRFLDIRRRYEEFFAIRIEQPFRIPSAFQHLEITASWEEYEIKYLTFDELLTTWNFYKINPNEESQVQLSNIEQILFDPEELLKLLKPLKKSFIPEHLRTKIRKSFDEERYKQLLEEPEQMELDLYSARSESVFDFRFDEDDGKGQLYSWRSKTSKAGVCEQSNDCGSLEEEKRGKNQMGVLFDNKRYDPLLSGRLEQSLYCRDKHLMDQKGYQSYDFHLSLANLSKIDPLTYEDFCQHLDDQFQEDIVDRPFEDTNDENTQYHRNKLSVSCRSSYSSLLSFTTAHDNEVLDSSRIHVLQNSAKN